MSAIRHGSVTLLFDMAEMARGKKVRVRVQLDNGEYVNVDIKGMDLLGALAKMTAVMNEKIDVLQRTLEEVRA